MLRGGQNQNTKRQQVERVSAKPGFLNKVFELWRDQSRLRTKDSGQRKCYVAITSLPYRVDQLLPRMHRPVHQSCARLQFQ